MRDRPVRTVTALATPSGVVVLQCRRTVTKWVRLESMVWVLDTAGFASENIEGIAHQWVRENILFALDLPAG